MVNRAFSASLILIGIGAVAFGLLLYSKGGKARPVGSALMPVGLITALLGTLLIFVPDFF